MKTLLKSDFFKVCSYLALFLYFSLFFAQTIDLSNSDIGRHIVNGWQVLYGNREGVLYSDFYSYTYPQGAHVNHHYLSGVVFYLIQATVGFVGLSIVYSLFGATFLFVLFYYGKRKIGVIPSLVLTLLLLPFLTIRTEVRPEMFTYVFFTFLVVLLTEHRKTLKPHHYVFIFVMQVFWINLHNHAVFAFIPTICFLLESVIYKDKDLFKRLIVFLTVQLLATFVSPFGYKTLLVPFETVGGMGVKPAENYSLEFGRKEDLVYLVFSLVGIVLGLFALIKSKLKFEIGLMILLVMFAFGAIYMKRLIPMYSIVFFVSALFFARQIPADIMEPLSKKLMPLSIFLLVLAPINPLNKSFGYGLKTGVQAGGEFYVNNAIKGPLYNDFNVGGYTIYFLAKHPDYNKAEGKFVYVHNVPESLPFDFLNTWLINHSRGNFVKKDFDKYSFNSILISTSTKRSIFLLKRLNDNMWVPVYYDDFVSIFVKDTSENDKIIDKYRLTSSEVNAILHKQVRDYHTCVAAGFKSNKSTCKTSWGKSFTKNAD